MSIIALFPFVALLAQHPVSSSSSLDFEYFKTRVQSILLAKREGHARCVSCHTTGTPMRFQPLSPGAAMWNEEESRKNFEVIRARVVAGNPLKSKLLTHPLAEEAGGHPNNFSISRDGRRVYVSIAQAPGAVDVIDTATMQRVKSINVRGNVHNTYVTPDGKFVVAGSVAGKTLTVIDAQTEDIAWVLDFNLGVRPMAFDRNPDGSTKRIFVQLSDFNGFAVVDFATHKEVTRVELPKLAAGKAPFLSGGNVSHGLAVTEDGKMLVVNSRLNSAVYAYSLPDLKLLGSAEVGRAPDWVTLTPDSKRAYVANAQSNSVSVIDLQAMKELTRIPVGQVPKRNITALLP